MIVSEMLRMECFQRAFLEVPTGKAGLDRRVRWIHSSEALDIGQFLHGDEVILTTGIELVRVDRERRHRYIQDLSTFGASGLVIERNRALTQIPPELIEISRTLNLPVLTVALDTSFMQITEQVHSAIMSEHHEALRWAETAERTLNELARNDASLQEILDYVAGQLNALVVLENEGHQIVALSGREDHQEGLIADWETHSRKHQARYEVEAERLSQSETTWGGSSCLTSPVWLRRELWGRLHVLGRERVIADEERLLVERGSAVLTMRLLVEAHTRRSRFAAHSALVSDIVRPGAVSDFEIVTRARSLGVELQRRELYAFIAERRPATQVRGLPLPAEEERQLRLEMVVQTFQACLSGNQVGGIVGAEGQRIIGVAAAISDERFSLDKRFRAIRARVETTDDSDLVIAISDPVGRVEELRHAFAQAETAASYAIANQRRGNVAWYRELGIGGLLIYASRGPHLARFVEHELGPLLQAEEARPLRLVATLQMLFQESMNKAATAKELGIDRRTLYRRLDAIERALGRRLDDHQDRLRVAVALEGLLILRARGHGLFTDPVGGQAAPEDV